MNTERKWSSEQISVPQELGSVLKEYTKSIIRNQVKPEHLVEWSANYFAQLAKKQEMPFTLNAETNHYEKNALPKELIDGEDQVLSPNSQGQTDKIQPVIIVGPSGVGKSTIIKQFMTQHPNFFQFTVSHTTRQPREGEKNGVDYYFTKLEEMKDMISDSQFVESANVHGNLYGTSIGELNRIMKEGSYPLLDIDVQGAAQIRKNPALDPIIIFVAPPSLEELEKRLRGRGTESDESLNTRLTNAAGEIEASKDTSVFDHVIVNDTIDNAVKKFEEVLGIED